MRTKRIIIIVGCLILLVCVYLKARVPAIVEPNLIKDSSMINYDSNYNFRQTKNDCAPFNAAAIVRILKKNQVDSADFAKQISWRLPNKYTLPIGLEKQLKDNGITIKIPLISPLSDQEKISYIKQELSLLHPIIILGKQDNYQHYLTLLGFNSTENVFYVYDSAFEKGEDTLTKDSNGDYPGNRTLTSEELITFWQNGGMYGLYKWYAIIAST